MVKPKVSCIMPTCYGDKYVEIALDCLGKQVYDGQTELVVVDNNEDNSPERVLMLMIFSDVYIRSKRKPVGALRNEGIKAATGEVICIWDEDDWHAPNRITAQVHRLFSTGKAVTGWHNVLYWDEIGGGTYKYFYSPGVNHPPYAMGASHCFLKSWWEKHPYVEQGVEDRIFSDEAMHLNQLDSCDADQLYVARIHESNVIRKNQYLGTHKQWPAVERSAFPKEFFEAINATKVVE